MSHPGTCELTDDIASIGPETDLATVLAAWHSATDRLQRTHEALRDEVCRLTNELESKNRELARKDRLADLGQMASHIAHEVRNGLVPVRLYVSWLRRRLRGEDLEILDKMAAGFTALEATVHDLLNFTSDRDPTYGRFDMRELVDEICQSLAPQLTAQHIRTRLDVAQGTSVSADRQMLRRAILNLVLNAVDAMPNGGELAITTSSSAGEFKLEIADTGPGVADADLTQVFEPFFTTKSGGTGLGLAIVQRIAEAHRGKIAAHNCPAGGAAFVLTLPQHRLEAAA